MSQQNDTAVKKPPLIVRFLKSWLPWKGDGFGEVIRKIIFLIALIVFIGSAVYIGNYFLTRYESEKKIDEIDTIYHDTNIDPDQVANLPEGYGERWASLYSINNNIKGWISIDDTNISFPVVQTSEEDPEHFLYRDFKDKYDTFGTPFLDARARLTLEENSDNWVIYGHHMKGKKVFGQLTNYEDLDFYKSHPIIQFDSVYKDMKWKIVSVFVTNTNPNHDNGNVFNYHDYINFENEEAFNDYIEKVKQRSILDTGVDVAYGDQLMTLSTCTYEFDDARFVVVARQVRDGEDPDAQVENAVYNPNTLYPQIWYDKFPQYKKPASEADSSAVTE